jgi:hypothetical protein
MECLCCGEEIQPSSIAYKLQQGGVTYKDAHLEFILDSFEDGEHLKWVCNECMTNTMWNAYKDLFKIDLPTNCNTLWLSKGLCSLCDPSEGEIQEFTDSYIHGNMNNPQASSVVRIEECVPQVHTKAQFLTYVPRDFCYVCFDCAVSKLELQIWSMDLDDTYGCEDEYEVA